MPQIQIRDGREVVLVAGVVRVVAPRRRRAARECRRRRAGRRGRRLRRRRNPRRRRGHAATNITCRDFFMLLHIAPILLWGGEKAPSVPERERRRGRRSGPFAYGKPKQPPAIRPERRYALMPPKMPTKPAHHRGESCCGRILVWLIRVQTGGKRSSAAVKM